MPLPHVLAASDVPVPDACCDMHQEHLSPSAGCRTSVQDKPQDEDGDFYLHCAHQPAKNPTPNPVIKPSSWLASPELLPRSRRLLGEQGGRDAEQTGQIKPGRGNWVQSAEPYTQESCCFPGTRSSTLPSPASTVSIRLAVLPLPVLPDPGQSTPECSTGEENRTAEPSCGQGQGDPSWKGTSPMLQDRLWALRWLPVQSILHRNRNHPCTGGGSGTVFAQCQMCSSDRDHSAVLGRVKSSTGCPRALPAGGCNKSCARLGSPAAAPGHPVLTLVQPHQPPRPTTSAGERPGPRHPHHCWPHSGHDPARTPATDIPRDQTLPSLSHWGGGLAPVCLSSPLGEPRRPRQVQGGCHEFLNS